MSLQGLEPGGRQKRWQTVGMAVEGGGQGPQGLPQPSQGPTRNKAEDGGKPHLTTGRQLERAQGPTLRPDDLLDFRLWGTEDAKLGSLAFLMQE